MNVTLLSPLHTNQEQVAIPFSNQHPKEMISDSVELSDTDACVLHIQLMGTNVRLPKIHVIPPEVDSESSKSPGISLGTNPIDNAEPYFPHGNIVCHSYEDLKMSGLQIRARYKHTFDCSPTISVPPP